jgi:hypothetical protein
VRVRVSEGESEGPICSIDKCTPLIEGTVYYTGQ